MAIGQRVRRRISRFLHPPGTCQLEEVDVSHRLDPDRRDNESAELLNRVQSLDPWFYPVQIGGVHVAPGMGSNQPAQRLSDRTLFREQLLVEEVVRRYDLKGKAVLEIACNMGYWSSRYVQYGADRVVGVEGRDLFLSQADLYWTTNQILPADRFQFLKGNVLDESLWATIRDLGPFDVVLCTGILYHLPDYRQLLAWIRDVTTDLLVLDTRVSDQPEDRVLEQGDLYFNAIEETRDKITPNLQSLLAYLGSLEFDAEVLKPRFRLPSSLPECDDYTRGNRAAILATRR